MSVSIKYTTYIPLIDILTCYTYNSQIVKTFKLVTLTLVVLASLILPVIAEAKILVVAKKLPVTSPVVITRTPLPTRGPISIPPVTPIARSY